MQPVEKVSVDDAPTRTRVTKSIMENGPSTAADLALRLHLTPAAVRRHLDQLLADGIVEARDQRVIGQRGRGRPAKVFALTDAGRSTFDSSYDELAVEALRFLAKTGGDDAVMAFARHRLSDLEDRYRPLLQLADPAQRPQVLADALSRDGFAASIGTTPAGSQMCQHHCPVAHVAVEFPQMCEAESEMFARLLGTHVQRLATIAHGDGVCTTHLPHIPDSPDTPSSTAAERLPS
ncbi:ArsR family transcriptional regulator [Aeromicrobium sp. S22]|uniref:helix-turn-helix transcriptional regulator n=1 Tax=Aeromicrobium sp. S22 TaxID=2662029 RepID=UPI00129EE53B|nr:metalloregulator ArsR/SmtB family transcription factor [Aeromicrobium sp. S22]MRK01948.1 ArsR family transcriptional regulator [Aeromicrobium sp. S22]